MLTPPPGPEELPPLVEVGEDERELIRLGLPQAAHELLAMVTYLTAGDGPLEAVAATGRLGDLHPRVLARMRERVDVIANFLRARISFFVTARREDVDAFDAELELAGANLVASRSLAVVIDRLISGALPDEAEFDRLGDAALGIYSAVEAL